MRAAPSLCQCGRRHGLRTGGATAIPCRGTCEPQPQPQPPPTPLPRGAGWHVTGRGWPLKTLTQHVTASADGEMVIVRFDGAVLTLQLGGSVAVAPATGKP